MARKAAMRLVRTDEAQQELWNRPRDPVVLTPIQWGTRDPVLARGICQHVEDATPPVVVTFNPFTHNRVRRVLRSIGVAH